MRCRLPRTQPRCPLLARRWGPVQVECLLPADRLADNGKRYKVGAAGQGGTAPRRQPVQHATCHHCVQTACPTWHSPRLCRACGVQWGVVRFQDVNHAAAAKRATERQVAAR